MSVEIDKILGDALLHSHTAGDVTDLTATLDPRYVNVTGDTMTGPLVITADGTNKNLVLKTDASETNYLLDLQNSSGTSLLYTRGDGFTVGTKGQWIKHSYVAMQGEGAGDPSMTGFYDRDELVNSDKTGSVTYTITGAGSVTNGNYLVDGVGGTYATIGGTDATTTAIQIDIDRGFTVSNYGSAQWQPYVQFRYAASTSQPTYYKKITCWVSADGINYYKNSSGRWETTDLTVNQKVQSYWFGTLGGPETITTWRYARFLLEERVEDPAYGFKANVWISQVGFRHLGARFTRAYALTTGDTLYGNYEIRNGLTTTGALLALATKEPTVVANDVLGRISFYAPLESAGSDAILTGASIVAVAEDTFSATVNKTSLHFQTGASETATTKMTIMSSGNVGIGTTAPAGRLHINGTANDQQLIIEGHSTQTLNLTEWWNSSGTTLAFITPLGGAVFNETGADADLRVEGDTDSNLLFVDASADKIGIGKNNPAYKLDVTGEINATTGYRVNGTAGATGTFTTADAKTVTVTNGIITSIV